MSTSPWQMYEGQRVDGKYHLVKFIGAGTFGGVFKAEEVMDDRLLRTVALKLVIPREEEDLRERQFAELQVNYEVDHPGFIRCYNVGRHDAGTGPMFYLAMELGERSLRDELQNGPLSEDAARELALEIASGLEYLHGLSGGLVHRDLKPENILRHGGRWKICDLGILRGLEGQSAVKSKAFGTHGYAPPESYLGEISPAWDVWSLGIILTEALSGTQLFKKDTDEAMMNAVLHDDPVLPETIPEHLNNIIGGCLAKDRRQRWTAGQVRDTLIVSAQSRVVAPRQFPARPEIAQHQMAEQDMEASALPEQPRYEKQRQSLSQPEKLHFITLGDILLGARSPSPADPEIAQAAWSGGAVLSKTLKGHRDSVQCIAFSPDGKYLATGSNDHTARLWNVARGKQVRILRGHRWHVVFIAFSPDGKYLATDSLDETARLWSVPSGRRFRSFKGQRNGKHLVAFSPDGKHLATVSAEATKLWEISSGNLLRTLIGHKSRVLSIAYSPDGKYLATGSYDDTARLWNASKGKHTRTLKGHSHGVNSVAFSPDGKYMATGGDDDTAKLWNVSKGKQLHTLTGHSQGVNPVTFSPDGKYLATGSIDKTAKLWDVSSGQHLHTLAGHSHGVNSVAFSPDGKYMATGSKDKTARLWDVSSGKHLHTLAGHRDWVSSLAFSPDGKYLATGSFDGTIRLWAPKG